MGMGKKRMLWILYILWEYILPCYYVDNTISHRLMQMI